MCYRGFPEREEAGETVFYVNRLDSEVRTTIIRYMAKYRNEIEKVMQVLKALSDENRIRALCSLEGRELCLCQIIELLDLAPSTVSKHMSILKQAGLVAARKEGRWMYYRFPDEVSFNEKSGIYAWIQNTLRNDRQIHDDRLKLKALLREDPEELCRRQCAKSCPK